MTNESTISHYSQDISKSLQDCFSHLLRGDWKLRKIFSLRRFSIQVLILWIIICIPGNVVTTYLYHTSNGNETIQNTVENISSLKCHEIKSEWKDTVKSSKFAQEGISISIIGSFGIGANLLSVIGKKLLTHSSDQPYIIETSFVKQFSKLSTIYSTVAYMKLKGKIAP